MGQAMLQQYEQAQHKQGNNLAQSKGRDNQNGADGDKDVLPKFLLLREVRLRLERGVERNAHTKPTRATLFLLTLSPMQDDVIPLKDT